MTVMSSGLLEMPKGPVGRRLRWKWVLRALAVTRHRTIVDDELALERFWNYFGPCWGF